MDRAPRGLAAVIGRGGQGRRCNASFDAAVCAVSVQYFVRPLQTSAEVGWALRSGAPFGVSFSSRCFPDRPVAGPPAERDRDAAQRTVPHAAATERRRGHRRAGPARALGRGSRAVPQGGRRTRGGKDVGWRVALPPSRHARLADFGVAVMAPIHWLPLDAEIAAALDGLAGRLGRLAVQVKTAQLHLTLLATMTSARLPADRRAQRLEVLRTRDDEWSRAGQRGIEGSAPNLLVWLAERESYRAAWRAFFRE